ncbi:MAG: alginate lyase family protein [bacterium]
MILFIFSVRCLFSVLAICFCVEISNASSSQSLFNQINLNHPGLEATAQAVAQKKEKEAEPLLLDYYRKRFSELNAAPAAPSEKRDAAADRLLRDEFTLQDVTAKQPRKGNGLLDWKQRGPQHDREWAWMLNRHGYFLDLLSAWRATGNSEYAACFDRLVKDWVASNPSPPWILPSFSASWRSMEVGRRLSDSWPQAFYGFQQAREFKDETRLAMLESVARQADFCMKHHARGGNHLNAEMLGLASAAVYWPEFKDAPKWLDYAVDTMRREFAARIYPDGAHQELSNHYQIVVARHFDNMASLLAQAQHPAEKEFRLRAKKLWDAVFLVQKPNGFGPLNNDADEENNDAYLAEAAAKRGWPSWLTLKNLKNPEDSKIPSVLLPWAGQIILRNKGNNDWLFFDAGPRGSAHQHNDKLHVSLFTEGRDVLVDAGRYTYRKGRWRSYFTGAASHNVVLIDGERKAIEPDVSQQPTDAMLQSFPQADFATAQTQLRCRWLERVAHKRSVFYTRDKYWFIMDEITSSRPHEITVLWHFHPDCVLKENGTAIEEKTSGLRLLPIGDLPWKLEIVRGQENPSIQGWWSPRYNQKQPSPVAIYTAKINQPVSFGWLLVKKQVPLDSIHLPSAP